MNRLVRLFESSIGCKLVMAFTGLGLLVFVLGHLVGNLQVFREPQAINDYAAFLKKHPPVLWGARSGLLALFGLHVYGAFRLYHRNRAARPQGYFTDAWQESTFAGRHMLLSGLVVLAFVGFHLLHFTLHVINTPTGVEMLPFDAQGRPDVHTMMVQSFRVTWVTITYVVAVVLLGLHLFHGTASVFQTLGWRNQRTRSLLVWGAGILTFLATVGYASIPIALYFGLVHGSTGG